MPTHHEVATLDARILARHDELEQEHGKPPTRRELGADLDLHRSRVQQAFTRAGRSQRAPGAGRPPKDAPLIDHVIAVVKAALKARETVKGLPQTLRRVTYPLTKREDWEDELRKAVEPPPVAEQEPGEQLDARASLQQLLAELRADSRKAKGAERARLQQITHTCAKTLAALPPPPEADGKTQEEREEYRRYGHEKHRQLQAYRKRMRERRDEERQQKLEQFEADGLLTAEVCEVLRRLKWELPAVETER